MSGPDPAGRAGTGPAGIAHVLLDADGVLQHVPDDWRDRLARHLGPEWQQVAEELWAVEKPALRGEGDFLAAMAEVLGRRGSPADADAVHAALWRSIEQVPTSIELVARLRAAGYGVHLGTNQHAQRAAVMRTELGYDDLFDVSVYSCEVGAAKPDAAYFTGALARLGAEPATVLFVDDRADNVEAARAAGLAAETWHHTDGLAELERLLARHGVSPAT